MKNLETYNKREILNFLGILREQKKITVNEFSAAVRGVHSLLTEEDLEYIKNKENQLSHLINDHRILNILGRNQVFTKSDLVKADISKFTVKPGPKTLEKIVKLQKALQNLDSVVAELNS